MVVFDHAFFPMSMTGLLVNLRTMVIRSWVDLIASSFLMERKELFFKPLRGETDQFFYCSIDYGL